MTDFARLVLVADSSQMANAERQIDRVAVAGERTERRVGTASSLMSASFRRVSIAAASMAGALIGTIASGRLFSNAIREAEQLERSMFRLRQIIQTTGGVAGKTAEGLHAQARELASATLASTEGVMQAQQTLLTFRNIRGQVFDDAIAAALDMSEALGTDLQSSIMQVAKALEDPVRGMTALSRSGTVFTEAQREMVKAMVEVGDTAGAQKFIMAELEAQYGGTARAAAQGLAGAADTLSQSWQEMSISLAQTFGLNAAAEAGLRGLSSAVKLLGDNMDIVRGVAIAAGIALTVTYTPTIIAATSATLAWVAALVTLRGALLASGIGAIVVLAGLAIAKFLELIEKTGGFGNALGMLANVAVEVWGRIGDGADAMVATISAGWDGMRSTFFYALHDMLAAFNRMIGSVAESINNVFGTNLSGSPLSGALTDLNRAGNDALVSSMNAADAAKAAWDRATAPLASVRALTDAMKDASDEAGNLGNAAGDVNAALSEIGGGSGGGSAGRAASGIDAVSDAARAAQQQSQQMAGMFSNAFASVISGAQSAKDALAGLLQQLSSMLANQAFQMLFSGLFGGGGAVSGAGLLGGLLRSFDGGGYTGNGARAGGLDGKGGFLAMMHPRETVVDHTKGGGGGLVRILIEEAPGFAARVRTEAEGVAVQVTRAGLQEYDRSVLPQSIQRATADPRRRG